MQFSRDYIVLSSSKTSSAYDLKLTTSDPYDDKRVKIIDQKLHRVLLDIFHKRRLTSGRIQKLINARENHINKNSIFKLILKQKPALGKLLLKKSKLSLLWITVLSGYQDSAELLVRLGADVNKLSGLPSSIYGLTRSSTILHVLMKMYPSAWNERFIDLVINHGADLEAHESDQGTALHLAMNYGRVKVAEMLLEKGANVEASRYVGLTPLLDAAITSEADQLVPLLMRYEADINVRDKSGSNALMYLAVFNDKEHVDLARFFIEEGLSPSEIVLDTYVRDGPIHIAAAAGKTQLVNLFLDYGADVNALGHDDETPLYAAAYGSKNPETLITLLKRGANIDHKSISGLTVLHGLFNHNSFSLRDEIKLQMLKILLYFDADMFAKTVDGLTIFDFICRHNLDNKCVRHILKMLALKEASQQLSTKSKIIEEKYPGLWGRYQACVEEVDRMRSTRFIGICTIFDVLMKCQCEVAQLMRNRKFQRIFKQFPIYSENLIEAFEQAEPYYKSMIDQENFVDDAITNIFPYMIVRKIAGYTLNCEICELRKIVQSSRSILR